MKEAVQVVINQNVDQSLRIDENKVLLTETAFEKDFKERFQKKNRHFEVRQYDFDYLVTENGHYKAIKIKIIDDENTTYQLTYVTDFNNL